MTTAASSRPPRFRNWPAFLALSPVWIVGLGFFVGTAIYTFYLSFTASGMFVSHQMVGLKHYVKLFQTYRWNVSLVNMGILAVTYVGLCLVIGFLMAAALDRRVRGESFFRTVYLYPQAVSFVVTGLVWQWVMNPNFGVQPAIQALGWHSFHFDWTQHPETAIYAVSFAGLWHGAGLSMILMLAGLRGVDQTLWQAARVEGIPMWRTYLNIILPEMRPAVITATTLLFMGIIRTYDLVVAMTNGGPGVSSELPAKFVMDNLFGRQNIGMASAGAIMLLITVMAVIVPVLYVQSFRNRRSRKEA